MTFEIRKFHVVLHIDSTL